MVWINIFGFILILFCIFFKEYIQQKGKDIATKEDIEEITSKIENVKQQIELNGIKSENLIREKIRAFKGLLGLLNTIKIYCSRELEESEHAVPVTVLENTSTFQKAVHLKEYVRINTLFLNREICKSAISVSHDVFMCGHMEMASETNSEIKKQKDIYCSIIQSIDELIDKMKKDIYE